MQDPQWCPSASLDVLKQRATVMQAIRDFFTRRSYLEVETPTMAHYGITDVYLSNIEAQFRQKKFFLQTSPEYHMKRLLAAGSGPIFQLARVFRDDELGRWHNPEFTLLEWYQLDCDHFALMDEVDLFLQQVAGFPAMRRKTYQQAFLEACALDPLHASIADFQVLLKQHELDNVLPADETDRDQYLFLLMSHVVEPFLAQEEVPVAVYHFPPSQAALAQIKEGVAERFEVYYQGVELANGFHELTQQTEQRARFVADQQAREKQGFKAASIDPWFLQALEAGLPPCSGIALGVERLLALMFTKRSIAEVMAFDFFRA